MESCSPQYMIALAVLVPCDLDSAVEALLVGKYLGSKDVSQFADKCSDPVLRKISRLG